MPSARKTVVGITSKNMKLLYNRFMIFGELTEKEWRGLDFECRSFLQSEEMWRRYQGEGREAYLVGVREGRKVLGAGLVTARPWRLGRKIWRVAGGWLLDYDGERRQEILRALTEGVRKLAREKRTIAVMISPNVEAQPRDAECRVVAGKDHLAVKGELERLGYKYLGEYEQAKWQYVLELKGQTAEGLFNEFRSGHRWQIRRAEKDGVRVRELGEEELGILKAIAAEAGERHGFLDPELEYYRSMKEYFGEQVKFVVAEIPAAKLRQEREKAEGPEVTVEDGAMVPLAAAMFVNDGREMVYLYSGSARKYQKYGGAHLIQWKMIQKALATGCERYNFYGVRPVAGDGVYKFKQGFRGHVEELLGTFALPVGVLGKVYVGRIPEKEMREVR